MDNFNDFDLAEISEKDLFEQLDSIFMKESEILDGNTSEDIEDSSLVFSSSHNDRPVDDLEIDCEAVKGKDVPNDVNEIEETKKPGNLLLRRTITELERALSDTKALLGKRDAENSKVRSLLISIQGDLEDEKIKCFEQDSRIKEQDATIQGLRQHILEEQNKVESLKADIQDKPIENKRRKEPCCAASEELSKIEKQNIKLEEQLEKLKAELKSCSDELLVKKQKSESRKIVCDGRTTKCKHSQKERDLQMKLRMKFMRDAFFYFMIDYHAEEQLRAILAILEYEDKRQDLIFEAHKMRQKGRKFNVSQVSSRQLTFVQEELK
eukprot:gene12182-13439_t